MSTPVVRGEWGAAVKQIARDVTGMQGDVTKIAELDRLFAPIKQERGRLDIIFAIRGIAKSAALEATKTGELELTWSKPNILYYSMLYY